MVSGVLTELLNGLTIGFVYVLLAAGLSVIFGVMNVINFAHGELFALGAYFAVAVIGLVGDGPGFLAALVVAPVLVGLVGVAVERVTIRPLYGRNPLYHILLTFGLVLIINETIRWYWGPNRFNLRLPASLSAPIEIFGFGYAAFNYFMIAFAAALALGVWALLNYTRFGLVIRAGAQDREMVRNLGIDIDRYYSLVFGLGAALAGVAGIILGGYQTVGPEMGTGIIIPAFVIVVLGGLGSFRGAVVAGLLVGIIQETLRVHVPILEGLVVFLFMIGILLVRPQGLFGTEAPESEGEEGELLAGSNGGFLEPRTRTRLGFLVLVLLALVPVGAGTLYSGFVVTLVVQALAWALFALSLDFVMGYTGLVSLGHALFYGAGAYTGILVLLNVTESAFVALGAAALVAAALAWVVGYLSIRVHGVYFAMITLGFAELFYNFITKLQITNRDIGLFGAQSYYGIAGVGVRLDEVALAFGPVMLTGKGLYYYVVLAALVGSFLLTRRMMRSPFGSVLVGIRENERRATFLGYDVTQYKRRAFVVSGGLAGLAGGLFALSDGFVDPSFAHWLRSGEVIVMVILGGMGTLVGPLVGAGAFFGLEHLLSEYTAHWRFYLGVLFVIFVIFFPRGLVSMPARLAPYLPASVANSIGVRAPPAAPPAPEEDRDGGEP